MNDCLQVSITKQLGDFSLDLSFTAQPGCLGILGASGSGKSMTLKSIAGIVTPDGGEITLTASTDETRPLYHSGQHINLPPQKRRVGYLFQHYALFPHMTVVENIAVSLGRGKHSIVSQLIQRFHLTGLEHHYPRQLSGGQQQRVALARMLAYQPDILLFDEPFSALDATLREAMRLELSRTLETYQGLSVLVSHDRQEIYQLCNQLVVLHQGKVVEQGDTVTLFSQPQHLETARLTGCQNLSPVRILNERQIIASAWQDLTLTLDHPIPADTTWVGLPSHLLKPCDGTGENRISLGNYQQIPHPAEAHYLLENGLHWRGDARQPVPQWLGIAGTDVLLLKG